MLDLYHATRDELIQTIRQQRDAQVGAQRATSVLPVERRWPGWIKRTFEVIELLAPRVVVTEHV